MKLLHTNNQSKRFYPRETSLFIPGSWIKEMNLRILSPIVIKTVNSNQLQSLLKSKPTLTSCDSNKPAQGIFCITERLHYRAWRWGRKSYGTLIY